MPTKILSNIHNHIIPSFDNVVESRELDALVAGLDGWKDIKIGNHCSYGYKARPDYYGTRGFSNHADWITDYSRNCVAALRIWKGIPQKWDGVNARWTLHYDSELGLWNSCMALNGCTHLIMGKGILCLAICVAYCKAKLRELGD